MTTEEKFHAAVNVIRSLPKHGSYQPSHELMLRFYAYFKQATEGPNTAPKPGFWEVVKKAKWDAWTKLGNMPKEEAMTNYVEELKKIVETMSYTDNVANFVQSLDSFYESVPAQDLELLIGPVLQRVRSQPGSPLTGSPLGSREASPTRNDRSQQLRPKIMHAGAQTPNSSESASPLPPESDDEDETFMDTVDINIENYGKENSKRKKPESNRTSNVDSVIKSDSSLSYPFPNVGGHEQTNNTAGSRKGAAFPVNSPNASQLLAPHTHSMEDSSDYQIIRNTVISLQRDLNILQAKMSHLESSVSQSRGRGPRAKEWPMRISGPSFTFLILWPIAVNLLFLWLQRKNLRDRL